MFVKITRLGVFKDNVYECSHVELRWHESSNTVIVDMEGVHSFSVEIEKPGTTIYYMNNNGRTVDTHQWGPLEPGPNAPVPAVVR